MWLSYDQIVGLIRGAGKEPAERDSLYRTLRTFEDWVPEAAAGPGGPGGPADDPAGPARARPKGPVGPSFVIEHRRAAAARPRALPVLDGVE
jgi:hypothetical protein